jgi:ketosteroid isomerase-like protein
MTKEFATNFATSWINSWNSHDLEDILSHYSEDFTIETPMAMKLYPQSKGIVQGKSDRNLFFNHFVK